jgi:hypothetical protein
MELDHDVVRIRMAAKHWCGTHPLGGRVMAVRESRSLI